MNLCCFDAQKRCFHKRFLIWMTQTWQLNDIIYQIYFKIHFSASKSLLPLAILENDLLTCWHAFCNSGHTYPHQDSKKRYKLFHWFISYVLRFISRYLFDFSNGPWWDSVVLLRYLSWIYYFLLSGSVVFYCEVWPYMDSVKEFI